MAIIKNCGNCKFWRKTTDYSFPYNNGECDEIKEKVIADVVYGWDGGYIHTYETDEDFGCTLHQPIEGGITQQ